MRRYFTRLVRSSKVEPIYFAAVVRSTLISLHLTAGIVTHIGLHYNDHLKKSVESVFQILSVYMHILFPLQGLTHLTPRLKIQPRKQKNYSYKERSVEPCPEFIPILHLSIKHTPLPYSFVCSCYRTDFRKAAILGFTFTFKDFQS